MESLPLEQARSDRRAEAAGAHHGERLLPGEIVGLFGEVVQGEVQRGGDVSGLPLSGAADVDDPDRALSEALVELRDVDLLEGRKTQSRAVPLQDPPGQVARDV